MKTIGIICNLMTSYGGVQTCVISLIKGLNQQGIIPTLLSDNIPKKELWEEHGLHCNIHKVNFSISAESFDKSKKILMPIWEFVFYFKTSWLDEEFDFIYIFQPNVMINNNQKHLFYLSMSPRAYNFSKTPFLTNVKNIFYKTFLKKIHPIFEFQNYNCVINSNYTAKMFYDYYGKKLDVVYPSNAVEKYIPDEINKKEKTVVFLSRLAPGKRVEKVVDLAKNYEDYTFYIIGAINNKNISYLKNIKKLIETYRLNNIEILVNQPYSNVMGYLSLSEYYVFFAENEHFGITTVEAMLFGCIPFVHNSGGQKEIVSENKLRFDNENMLIKFNDLININKLEKQILKNILDDEVSEFKEEVFINKMLAYID